MAYVDELLDDGEFLFLYDYYEPVDPSYPYWDFDPFCLDSFDSCECEAVLTCFGHLCFAS